MTTKAIRDQILDMAKIEDVISGYRQLERAGSGLVCCCPVHNEKTPSFHVSPIKNIFKCFSCGVGGNAIDYLVKVEGMSYMEALKTLGKKYNISIPNKLEESEEDEEAARKREAMLYANQKAQEFFEQRLQSNDEKAKQWRDYAINRWGEETVKTEGIGFAPGHDEFRTWAKAHGLSEDILLELGLLRKDDKGRIYDGFYDRLTIPIKSRSNNVLGFTARSLTDEKRKYINSPDSPIFHKGEIIFGLQNATRQGASTETFYLVEGGPDVIHMQGIGVANTIAPLGTAWTREQFAKIKRFNATLCFIPDIDPPKKGEKWGPGINAVIKNGKAALKEGFRVQVREIQQQDKTAKADPDSFIKSKEVLEAIPKEDFVFWYAQKLIKGDETSADKAVLLKDIAVLIGYVRDRSYRKILIKQVARSLNITISIVESSVNESIEKEIEERMWSGSKLLDRELYQEYGFYEKNNCYYSMDDDGKEEQWSNFTLQPLFHIADQLNPKRLFRIRNAKGDKKIIEMKQEDLVSLQKFKLKVEGIGNFVWRVKEEQLTRLKSFLYDKTDTAVEITQLGWNRDGFFAFGNGIVYHGAWLKADEFGIVRLDNGKNYYLPASSLIYRDERALFQFERRFVHMALSEVSLRTYTDKLYDVFGDNAKVGFAFYLAALFKDVVTSVTKNFPILNLFGPKGSGKSELGHSLMSFFIIKNDPPNLSSATDAALAETVAQCANALVHVDEYKNTIELNRREFLKSLYDGVGRTRMNMDRDKKRETTAVDCGVILSGQEMPTVDIAIFSRMIFLTFKKSEFSTAQKRRFDEMKRMRDLGMSHLTIELLKHRKMVEANFAENYKEALGDVIDALENDGIEDRILRNWIIPLAMFRTMSNVIDVSFTYQELLKIAISGIREQNSNCRNSNELGVFWNIVDFLHQDGKIFYDSDYRVKLESSFKGRGQKSKIEFQSPKKVLYLCWKRVVLLYKIACKQTGDTPQPKDSLEFYLRNSKEYLGIKNAVRFKNMGNQVEASKTVERADGRKTIQETTRVDWAFCFDYDALIDNYGINLEVSTAYEDEIDPTEADESSKQLPY